MNHGFAVDRASLPANAEETHVRCSTARTAASPLPTGRPSPCSIIPRPRQDRATAIIVPPLRDLIAASKAEAGRAAYLAGPRLAPQAPRPAGSAQRPSVAGVTEASSPCFEACRRSVGHSNRFLKWSFRKRPDGSMLRRMAWKSSKRG